MPDSRQLCAESFSSLSTGYPSVKPLPVTAQCSDFPLRLLIMTIACRYESFELLYEANLLQFDNYVECELL